MEKGKFKFRAKDFYSLLDRQKDSEGIYRCYATGRELTPENCWAVHQLPLALGGEHSLNNIVLVIAEIALLKKTLSDSSLIALAEDILSNMEKKNAKKDRNPNGKKTSRPSRKPGV